MAEKAKLLMVGVCGALATLVENYGVILLFCCIFILIDLVTGLAKAKIHGKVKSSVGYRGFWRKTALIAALVFGICLDCLIWYITESNISPPIGRILGLYIAINESISICDNLLDCSVQLPKFILPALAATQRNLNNPPKKKLYHLLPALSKHLILESIY